MELPENVSAQQIGAILLDVIDEADRRGFSVGCHYSGTLIVSRRGMRRPEAFAPPNWAGLEPKEYDGVLGGGSVVTSEGQSD